MRLLATGICVRAARSARLIAVASQSTLVNPIADRRRYASTQAVAESESTAAAQDVVPIRKHYTHKGLSKINGRIIRGIHQEDLSLDLPESHPFIGQSSSAPSPGTTTGSKPKTVLIDNRQYSLDSTSNLSSAVTSLVGLRLYDNPNHPICITRKLIESVFPSPRFYNHVAYNPVATVEQNFDILGFPKDHPGRSRTDTYYVNAENVLRTHTSAHQHQAFQHLQRVNADGYTICADVYRRDSIDKSHFPVFHQMEGAMVWKLEKDPERQTPAYILNRNRIKDIVDEYRALPQGNVETVLGGLGTQSHYDLETNPPQLEHSIEEVRVLVTHLKLSLTNLVGVVFDKAREAGLGDEAINEGEKLKVRWVEAYFPFTSPSLELEIFWKGEWMELLGSGVVQDRILKNAGLKDSIGWAWGIGVERLAMILFGIPDIRLFWSEDPRFLSQFKEGQITKFVPFSKYPACYKDVAFWINAAPAAASPITAAQSSSPVAVAAGGDARIASPAETQPAAFHENDVMEIVRDVAGSLAEDVQVVDEFVHPTSGRKSLCYRINYRSLERTLKNEEVNQMHNEVRRRIAAELSVELR